MSLSLSNAKYHFDYVLSSAMTSPLRTLALLVICNPALSLQALQAVQEDFGPKTQYQTWMDEDVRWIITDQEKSDFSTLITDQEFRGFITAFWANRDPSPDSLTNEREHQHYLRMLYANQHFSIDSTAGWSTDRGQIYVLYGEPTSVSASRSDDGNHGETWHYQFIEGVNGSDITFAFFDYCLCGKLELAPEWLLNSKPMSGSPPIPVFSPQARHKAVMEEFRHLATLMDDRATHFSSNRHEQTSPKQLIFTVDNHLERLTNLTDLLALHIKVNCASLNALEDPYRQRHKIRTFIRLQTLGRELVLLDGALVGEGSQSGKRSLDNCTALTTSWLLPIPRIVFRFEIGLEDETTHQFGYWYRGIKAP